MNFEGDTLQHVTDINCVMKPRARGKTEHKGHEKQKGLAYSGNQKKVNVT